MFIQNPVASSLSQFQYKKAAKLTLSSSSPRKHLKIVINNDEHATPDTNMKTSSQLESIRRFKNETPNSLCLSPISGSISKKRHRESLVVDSNVDPTLRDKDSNVTDIFIINPKRPFKQLDEEEKEQIFPAEIVCLDQSSNEDLDFMNDESATDKSMKAMNISDENKEVMDISSSSRRFNFKPKVSKLTINCYNCGFKVCDYLPNANESLSESFIKCLPNQIINFLEATPKNLRIITEQIDEKCFEANSKLTSREFEKSNWKFYNCNECLSLIGCMPVFSEGKNSTIINRYKNKIIFLSQS